MKRILFYSTIVALILGTMSFFTSCEQDHDQFAGMDGTSLKYEFSVDDQINVDSYVIEYSEDASLNTTWYSGAVLMATQEGLVHKYTLLMDVTDFFEKHSVIYTRIKSVDKDGKVAYTKTTTTMKP